MSTQHKITVPEPCHENWNAMSPTEQGRFCDSCAKVVTDFSKSSPAEIVNTLKTSQGAVCGRFRKEQLHQPETKLIDLIPIDMSQAAKVAAAALAFFAVDTAVAQENQGHKMGKMAASSQSYHQGVTHKVRGVVLDESGSILPFANVFYTDVKGTASGISTDLDGRFELDIPASSLYEHTLELHISFVGYAEKVMHLSLTEEQFIEVRLDDAQYFLVGEIMAPSVFEDSGENDIEKEFNRVKAWAESAEEERIEKLAQDKFIPEPINYEIGEIEYVEDTPALEGIACSERIEEVKIEEVAYDEVMHQSDTVTTEVEVIDLEEVTVRGHAISLSQEDIVPLNRDNLLVVGLISIEPIEKEAPVLPVSEEPEPNDPETPAIKAIEPSPGVLKLYPNPSAEVLYVEPSIECTGIYHIVDMRGKVLLQGSLMDAARPIAVTSLAVGNYIIQMTSLKGERLAAQFSINR